MEVCQHFGYYLPGSTTASQMTTSQRAVNMLYALRDYSPVTTSLALVMLPIALLLTPTDELNIDSPVQRSQLFWIRVSFMVMYLTRQINGFVMYKHVGLSKVANFSSHEVWVAPCKSTGLTSDCI